METTKLEVKGIKLTAKKKLKIECAKREITYAQWIEEKLYQ